MSAWNVNPETLPAEGMKRPQRVVWLALEGYPRLAADSILDAKNRGMVEAIVGEAVRQLGLMASIDPETRRKCYEALVEVALNLAGMESKRAGFSDEETEAAFKDLVESLRRWEAREGAGVDEAAKSVVREMLAQMNKVLMGQSMVAEMAHQISRELNESDLLASFLLAARKTVNENVYYQIVDKGLSKIGNDSATGLRWLRHLGAVQVSSNPVIAARAFEELPELWKKFDAVATVHPEWKIHPEKYADEIAMFATITSLLPNVLDFRPIALLSGFRDGMVSIQLNPFKAGSTEGSKEDAQKIYGILQEILRGYDACLTPDAVFDGRPNVVFKVASNSPTAIETTKELNELGIGTNNTVTFTATQEISMVIAAGLGLARAVESGVPVGRVYITNMEGRLEDHLREVVATKMLLEVVEKEGAEAQIAAVIDRLGAGDSLRKSGTLKEKASTLCSKKYLKSLTDDWFVKAVGQEKDDSLRETENDLRMAGIMVTRRVFQLAFAPEDNSKIVAYIKEKAGVSYEQARVALGMVDLLPASKRRAEDTLQVLGANWVVDLTNTDFPDQQLRVWTRSQELGFKISDYQGSILTLPDESCLQRLLKIEDFRRAYQLTPSLLIALRHAGIDPGEDGGLGLAPKDWASYGPVVKTMHEFEDAYARFREGLVDHLNVTPA